jgi:hypothetical protein
MKNSFEITAYGAVQPIFNGGTYDVADIKRGEFTRNVTDKRGNKKLVDVESMEVTPQEGGTFHIPQDSLGGIVLRDGKTIADHFRGKTVEFPASGRMSFVPSTRPGTSGETNGRKWQIHDGSWDIDPKEVKVIVKG